MGQHEAAGMLAEMARRAHQLPRQIEREPQAEIGHVEVELVDLLLADAIFAPAPDAGRERRDHVFG